MKLSGSTRQAMRSRAFSWPACLRFASFSGPPIASALAPRASYSANNASNAIFPSHAKKRGSALQLLHFRDERGNEFLIVADNAVTRILENCRLRIGVDGNDSLGVAASCHVMPRARNADGDVQFRRHGPAGKPDLPRARAPAQIAGNTAPAHRPAHRAREIFECAKPAGALQASAARPYDFW